MEHYAFWADTDHEEGHMWQQCMEKVQHYPEAPIYHYGSYELRAVVTSRNGTIQMPEYAQAFGQYPSLPLRESLLSRAPCDWKAIGHFLGARWSAPQASGLQSLVWRHQWEDTQDETYRDLLVTYNREDCHVLKQLTDELSRIQQSADTLAAVDFADQRKHQTTETSEQIQRQFRAIRKFAQLDYDSRFAHFC